MKKLIYTLLIVVVALFGLTFSYKNHQPVEINYYFGLHFQGQLPLLLFLTFALGLLAGYLIALFYRLSSRLKPDKIKKVPLIAPLRDEGRDGVRDGLRNEVAST